MGIISLNEKRTSTNPTHTTGKEKSFFTSDKYPELLGDAKITGKYHYDGAGRCGFGVFWESTTGAISNLTFSSTSSPVTSWTERTSPTHANDYTAWSSFEIDLADKPSGRPVFYVRLTSDSGSSYTFQSDWCLDDVELETVDGSTISFDPSSSSVRSAFTWRTTDDSNSSAYSYSGAQGAYDSSDLAIISNTNGSNNGKWNYHFGSTGSGGTGPDNAADNSGSTYYLYFESSGSNNNSCTFTTWKDYRNLITGATA